MKRMMLAAGAVAILAAAGWFCAQFSWEAAMAEWHGDLSPHVGRSYIIQGSRSIYFDKRAFDDAVVRSEARTSAGYEELGKLVDSGALAWVDSWSIVKAIEIERGGARVVVAKGSPEGKIGWMLDSSLAVVVDPITSR